MNKRKPVSIMLFKLFFWLTLFLVALLSMLSVPAQQLFQWQDKLSHLLVYMVLFWLLVLAYGKQWSLLALGGFLTLFGGGIELAQSFKGYRQAEWFDLLANVAGIVLAILCYKAFCLIKNYKF